VLCSIAILRKLQLIYTQGNAGNALTDNRALTAQTETKQGIESPNRDKTGSVGCVWPQRAYSAGREGRRGSKGSAVEAVGPPLAWGAYYRGLVIQHKYIQKLRRKRNNKATTGYGMNKSTSFGQANGWLQAVKLGRGRSLPSSY
jgi:hypothetical protein